MKLKYLLLKVHCHGGVSLSAVAMVGVLITLTLDHKADYKSAKGVVDLYKAQHDSKPIVFLSDKPF